LLFSDAILDDLRRVPGARHSFARQLAHEDGEAVRAMLEDAATRVPAPVRERWRGALTSLENRRFFQGFGEAAATVQLGRAGWTVTELAWPGPSLVARHESGVEADILVLSFIRQVRPGPDAAMIGRLHRALDRVGSRARIAVLVRRWLPHDFDPEPVRRAIDLWLREVDRGGWDGRYAAYDDEHVSLEFALTGEQAAEGEGVVAFTIGPFESQRTLEAIERRMVAELDRDRLHRPRRDRPTLVVTVTDQPYRVSPGYLRELFLGKPFAQVTDPDRPGLELWYGARYAPCLFRDPHYRHVAGVVMVERPADAPAALQARAWLNPWADPDLTAAHVGCPALSLDRFEDAPGHGGSAVLRWQRPD
jgi:hypothetical protein